MSSFGLDSKMGKICSQAHNVMGKEVEGKIIMIWGMVGGIYKFLWEIREEKNLAVYRQDWGAGW